MSEDKPRQIHDAGEPLEAQPTEEEERDTDRSTIWYCIGNSDDKILRMTLMDQDRQTLEAWHRDAVKLQSEIRRTFVWLDAESPDVGN